MIIRTCIDELLHIAELQYGYLEKASDDMLDDKTANVGEGNFTKYNRDMKQVCPEKFFQPAAWCDSFCDWCMYKEFGTKKTLELIHGWSCYTPDSARYFQDHNEWFSAPQRGDQVFFHNDERICHTGFVVKTDDKFVYTIEGNTGDMGMEVERNGGCVNYKQYEISDPRISGYGRPAYPLWHQNDYVAELQEAINNDLGIHIKVDGIAGPRTQEVLNKVVLNAEKEDMSNTIVVIQKRLNIPQSKIFDTCTLNSVIDYQKKSGVLEVNGVIEYETLMRLINIFINN